MADKPKPGRAAPVPERFEVFEAHPTAHLTEEQKKWPVVNLAGAPERFEVWSSPALQLTLPPGTSRHHRDEDRFARILLVLDTLEQLLGGRGLDVAERRVAEDSGREMIVFTPRAPDGAASRLARLAEAITALGLGSARVA